MPVCTYDACKKEVPHLVRGYCPNCYAVFQRRGTPERIKPNRSLGVTECSVCGCTDKPFVRSLCGACYQRKYKTGSTDYQRRRRVCERPGCDDPVKANGLCQRHYMRVRRHGSPDAGRPEGWGAKSKHPMWEAWKSMTRAASSSFGMDPRWNDFWVFLDDMGERPEPSARLYRKDENGPYNKENCEWRAPILDKPKLANRAEYMRALRIKRPESFRKTERRRLYRMDDDDHYYRMMSDQNDVCAICKSPETVKDPRSGELFALAVDHDRLTGIVRGLLCMGCNTGIGGLKHSVDNLRAAIAYLERHTPA